MGRPFPLRAPVGTPAGGRFAAAFRAEAGPLPAGDGRIWVDAAGDCPECGHTQEPGKTCENCDPSCAECGGPMESGDQSLCDRCQERADDDAWYDDEEGEDDD